MFDFLGGLISSGLNYSSQQQANALNQQNFDKQFGFNVNNMNTGNLMLEQFLQSGKVSTLPQSNSGKFIMDADWDRMPSWVRDTFKSKGYKPMRENPGSGDQLNPFLALSQHAMAKDALYNGTQIKVNDLKKAGLSPLLASSGGATLSGGSSGYHPLQSGLNNNTQSVTPIQANTGFLKELAELKLLDKQADKVEAETNTEYEKASNLNENTKLLIAQTSHELSKQNLTKAQISKYEKDIEILINDFNISKDMNMRYKDNKPYIFNAAEDLVSNLGIDSGTALFDWLVGAVVGTVFLSKAGTVGNIAIKGGKKVLEYGKTLGHKGKQAFDDGINYVKSKLKKDTKDDNFEPPHVSEPFN